MSSSCKKLSVFLRVDIRVNSLQDKKIFKVLFNLSLTTRRDVLLAVAQTTIYILYLAVNQGKSYKQMSLNHHPKEQLLIY